MLASVNIGKYARYFQSTKTPFVANEIRWFLKHGRDQLASAGVFSDLPEISDTFEKVGDQQLVALYSQIHETLGVKLIFPTVESVLAGSMSGLSAQQIAALGMVQWHAHLLSQDADMMTEFLRMTFTVMDDNHPRIVENHEMRCAAYALRSEVLLRVIRRALELLR